jgi:hypothetical protein
LAFSFWSAFDFAGFSELEQVCCLRVTDSQDMLSGEISRLADLAAFSSVNVGSLRCHSGISAAGVVCGRESDTELARFLRISLGSANELHSHLRLARDLGFLDEARHVSLSDEALALQRMLAAFIQRLKATS